MQKIRELYFYDEEFVIFLDSQPLAIRKKFNKIFKFIQEIDRVPINYFKKIQNSHGLYEIRISLGTNIWRVFCFFEANRIVVVLNGYLKKEMRTSPREIERAIKLMNRYYEEKK
jgi:phage-related protein